MPMQVMHVRRMRMDMLQGLVLMRMGVGLAQRFLGTVRMPMVLVVNMGMRV